MLVERSSRIPLSGCKGKLVQRSQFPEQERKILKAEHPIPKFVVEAASSTNAPVIYYLLLGAFLFESLPTQLQSNIIQLKY